MERVSCNDLNEVVMDLRGMEDLLTLMASSEYYSDSPDAYICRALCNNITETKRKLMDMMGGYYKEEKTVEVEQ